MIRILFSVLAVVAVVLAIVLDQPLFYAVAAALLLVAFVLLLVVLRGRHGEAKASYAPQALRPEDDLKSLGIMDIRPRERSHSDEAAGRSVASRVSTAPGRPAGRTAEFSAARPTPRTAEARAVSEPAAREPLVSFFQAMHAALGADTVCLIKQADMAPDYQVIVLADVDGVRRDEAFSTAIPLLSASMAQHPVTVQPVGDRGMPAESLGYTRRAAAIRQVAVAPVPRPNDPEFFFVLADSTNEDDLRTVRAQTLLAHFARLLSTLLEEPPPVDDGSAEGDEEALRPRREIIAEEMAQARAARHPLALALVYLNRAEHLAQSGAEAVQEAETLLEARLQHHAPDGRVERFGELTYGIFFSGSDIRVEHWGERVQHGFSRLTGPLEGGVSIGIALMQDRHRTPDALRTDATEALREAYLSGACTIVE